MAYLAILSAGSGRKAGFSAVMGVAVGLLAIGLAAALGVGAIIARSSLAWHALRWCGVLYMLWLAWDGWNTTRETSPDKTGDGLHRGLFFWRGFTTNVLNPKAAVFYIAILPGFVSDSSVASTQIFILTLVYVAIATGMHAGIVTLAGSARAFLNSPRRVMVARRVLSLLLAVVAVWFVISTGKSGIPVR